MQAERPIASKDSNSCRAGRNANMLKDYQLSIVNAGRKACPTFLFFGFRNLSEVN
jgi:hypothetical protein